MENSVQQHSLVILSHHKCATNWLRGICRELAKQKIAKVEVVGGIQKAPKGKEGRLPTILLNVNAGAPAKQILLPNTKANIHFIRDPRDAFVSNYFSWRYSHQQNNSELLEFRERAENLSVEEGMIELVDRFPMGRQLGNWTDSMWEATTPIRYEDMLADFSGTFAKMFSASGIDTTSVVDAVREATNFKKVSGRDQGEEDVNSHFRKGKAGDWVNHFTPRLSAKFFAKHGWLGEKTGYW